MAVRASEITIAPREQRPGPKPISKPAPARTPDRNRILAPIGFSVAALLIIVGWNYRDRNFISADEGLGYALGIVSVACMLTLLLYPLRKRWRFLRFLGSTPKWFRNHMVLGVTVPIAALYHCNFTLGSLNSRIALFSALIVAGSGLVGRFIYRKIHHGLYGRKANFKELLKQVKLSAPADAKIGGYVPELMRRIALFDRQVLKPPESMWQSIKLPFVLAIRTRIEYIKLFGFIGRSLRKEARRSPIVAEHRARLHRSTRRFVSNHFRHVRRVAGFIAYERLFALWHKVHVPFFVTLFLSTIIHVVSVHVY